VSGRRGLPVVVIAVLLAATGVAAAEVMEAERDRAEEDQMAVAGQAATQARSQIQSAAGGLSGAQGLLKPSGRLRVRGFRIFARRVARQQGFLALAYHPLVPAERRQAFERDVSEIVAPGPSGRLRPVERAGSYLPARFVHGDLMRRTVLGLDALAVTEQASAAQAARDAGTVRASAPVTLAGSDEHGLTLFEPLYLPGRPIRTVGGRRKALQGEVSAELPARRLADGLASGLPAGVSVSISDGDTPVIAPTGGPADQASAPIQVAGRMWTVSVGGVGGASALPAAAIGGAGLAVTALVWLLFALAARRERRLEESRAAAERAATREALLVRVGDSLERTVSLEGRLDELARAVVPGLADLCTVDLELDEQGLRRVGVAAEDPRRERVLRMIESPPATGIGREALLTGEVKLIPFADEGTLRAMSDGGAGYRRLRSLEIESMILAPLWARARVLGVLTLCTVAGSARRPYDEDDAALAGEIADRAALALDNARLYEQQLDIAQTLQRGLLPRRLPSPPRLEVAARYRAGHEGFEVGGDFYDLFNGLGGGWAAVVGDVCGKGADAAALTSLVRHTLRAGADFDRPAGALQRVDRAVYEETGGATFCTLAYALIEADDRDGASPARVIAATGGHPEPLIARRDGGVERVRATGPLLGAFGDASFGEHGFELQPGDTLLLFTDGVLEARSRGELFGEERLEALVSAAPGIPLEELLRALEEAVVRFAGGRPQDDVALLALRLLASSAGRGQ
jgi:serine phosphatase RsbU (regulator of sigma subunit)